MKLFHRVKSPANSVGSGSGDGGDANITRTNAATTAASSSISSSVAATTTTPVQVRTTNVQVVARIRPVIIKSSDENQSFFHVKSPSSSRRRRLIGLRKKDSKGSSSSSSSSGSVSTASETLSSSQSSISDNVFEAWDLIDDDTAKQSSRTEQIKGRTNSYTLDKVFGPTSTTSQIYNESIKPLVVSAMEGYHSTVLAYGQTSTGMFMLCSCMLFCAFVASLFVVVWSFTSVCCKITLSSALMHPPTHPHPNQQVRRTPCRVPKTNLAWYR